MSSAMTPEAQPITAPHTSAHLEDRARTEQMGYWLYLMSDAILFVALFATYAVLHANSAGGPEASDIFEFSRTALNSALLLTSTLVLGFSGIGFAKGNKGAGFGWLAAAFALGALFVGLEVQEFAALVAQGASPQTSGFLSAYFALVATHGLHVTVGLIWMLTYVALLLYEGPTRRVLANGNRLAAFWHMIGIVWIGIYSVVYLPGILQ
ncbi:Cytochrome bo(3) ubiquinol oxidase subunit 3 [Aquimixticola soesokkakensis]|uniref:Cytochrome bo(3) ubiquinol oxidase subunit 3 n=1 Tax=Aquimixticola soesokkakensis TaxID=1519096 RepID=A0A1Y5T9S8_9RHOB|nr:cytochrome c oxidase subunit 3 [Aquimixticola soesokkakensis]SLN55534.1 Cytochrome bo(3) ubiquinol oxidase subunit 3 [Aquimixticola soesokkakensis]